MKPARMQLLAALNRSRDSIATALQQSSDPAERAGQFAKMLRDLWPTGELYACLLWQDAKPHLAVIDRTGEPRAEWTEPVLDALCHSREISKLPVSRSTPMPAELNKPDLILATNEVAFQGQRFGMLAFALAQESPTETATATRTLLATCAEFLALRLHIESREKDWNSLQHELAGLSWRATVGELVGPLVHELNNFLNATMLHLAVLSTKAPPEMRVDLTELRRQGNVVSELVQHLQHYRHQQIVEPHQVDLNQVVRAAVEELTGDHADSRAHPPAASRGSYSKSVPDNRVPVRMNLSAGLPRVWGSAADLRRLCTFLVKNAMAAVASGGGAVSVQTEAKAGAAALHVEDSGPNVSPDKLCELFEASVDAREGIDPLELAACKMMVKRLNGNIRGGQRAGGGVAIHVELPTQHP